MPWGQHYGTKDLYPFRRLGTRRLLGQVTDSGSSGNSNPAAHSAHRKRSALCPRSAGLVSRDPPISGFFNVESGQSTTRFGKRPTMEALPVIRLKTGVSPPGVLSRNETDSILRTEQGKHERATQQSKVRMKTESTHILSSKAQSR